MTTEDGTPATGAHDRLGKGRSDTAMAVEGAQLRRMAEIKADLLSAGRASFGVTGTKVNESLLSTLRSRELSPYPLLILGLLGIVDSFQGAAFGILAPDIARTLGLSVSEITYVLVFGGFAAIVVPFAVARYVQRRPRRALIAIVAGIVWSLVTLASGFVTSIVGLIAVLLADKASTGAVQVVHYPLLMDSYPSNVRVRLFSAYQSIVLVGVVVSPLLVSLLTGPLELTWRGTLLALGVICVVVSIASLWLRDPGFGRFDIKQLREKVREAGQADEADAAARPPRDVVADDQKALELGLFESVRAMLLVPTVRRLALVTVIFGVFAVPLGTFFTFFLETHWHLGPSQRALLLGLTPLFSIVAILTVSRKGEGLYRQSPPRLMHTLAVFQLGSLAFLALAIVAPNLPLVVICYGVSGALTAVLGPSSSAAILAVIEPRLRPHAQIVLVVANVGVGGIAGALILGGVTDQYGSSVGLLVIILPGILAAYVTWTMGRTINLDLDRLVNDVIDKEQIKALREGHARLPLLSCRNVDFSYGRLEVLFGVDFAVDEGEMVALLGTNGAGKSTLLRVISGIGLPARGSIRFQSSDITYIDTERRVKLGISQIPGGTAVFGTMNVLDNLRVYGHTLGRSRRDIDRGIDEAMGVFPRLAERRRVSASTLSGGEQQMLALSKALILRPKLLCIDEFSLGLSPKTVAELLEIVRRINATGTAVVLVEQSVNLALSVAERAYFMERGRMVFGGRSSDLLARPDLLRSVFLEGAAKKLNHTSARAGTSVAPDASAHDLDVTRS